MLFEPVDIYAEGVNAADALISRMVGVPIEKTLDPLDDRQFVTIVTRVARRIARAAVPVEERARTRAREVLDVDWRGFGVNARRSKLDEADSILAEVPGHLLPGLEGVLEVSGPRMVESTRRRMVAKHRLRIYSTTEERHTRTAKVLTQQTGLFVRDNYGEIRKRLSGTARRIVADGVETGLGSKEISSKLAEAMAGARRPDAYWDLIAMTFSNRARVFTQIATMEEARIDAYIFSAVMDSVTTRICRYLNRRVFSVQTAAKRIQRVQDTDDPEQIKALMPWVQEATNENGQRFMYFEGEGGAKRVVAQVLDGGERFGRGLKESALERAGVSLPPCHGRCRSTVIPA